MFRWIDSAGGSLILVERRVLADWHGVDSLGLGKIALDSCTESDLPFAGTDYARACAIDGYLGIVEVGGSDGLVLGDEPLSTTWLDDVANGPGLIARWGHGESIESVTSHFVNLHHTVDGGPAVTLTVGKSPLVLFDSALPGALVDATESLEIQIPSGRYRVATAHFRPDHNTWLVLHRFEPILLGVSEQGHR